MLGSLLHLALASTAAAAAQDPPRWTLEEVVAIALEEHPAILAARERITAAEGVTIDAGRWRNPQMFVSGENYPLNGREFDFSNEMEWFAYVTQTFETAGKRGHRKEVAAMEQELAAFAHEVVKLDVSYAVKSAYAAAIGANARLDLARDTHERLEQLSELNRLRSAEGYIAEGDFIKAKLESERFGYAARTAALDHRRAEIALLTAMGRSAFDVDFELAAVPPTESVELDEAALKMAALARPEVQMMETAIVRAQAFLELQQSTAHPDVSAQFGYKRNGPDNALYGGVSVPLPLFDRNQGGVLSARAELAAAEAELALRRSRVLGELEAALEAVRSTREQVRSLRADFIARADASLEVALAAYREGAASLLVVIEAERARNVAEELMVEALRDHRLAIHELERATGLPALPAASVAAEEENP